MPKSLFVLHAVNFMGGIPENALIVVRNFGESSVDLQLRVWIKDARKRMDTISHVTDRLKTVFDREGIEIPFPKRDITIVEKS